MGWGFECRGWGVSVAKRQGDVSIFTLIYIFRNICKCLGTKFIKNQEVNILIDAVESKLTGIKEIKSYVEDNVFCCPEQGATMFDSLS